MTASASDRGRDDARRRVQARRVETRAASWAKLRPPGAQRGPRRPRPRRRCSIDHVVEARSRQIRLRAARRRHGRPPRADELPAPVCISSWPSGPRRSGFATAEFPCSPSGRTLATARGAGPAGTAGRRPEPSQVRPSAFRLLVQVFPGAAPHPLAGRKSRVIQPESRCQVPSRLGPQCEFGFAGSAMSRPKPVRSPPARRYIPDLVSASTRTSPTRAYDRQEAYVQLAAMGEEPQRNPRRVPSGVDTRLSSLLRQGRVRGGQPPKKTVARAILRLLRQAKDLSIHKKYNV